MKKNLLPEQKELSTKQAIITNLDKTVRLATTCVSSIRYFEKTDMVRIRRRTDGYSVFISAEGKNSLALLHETVNCLMPFLAK